LSCDHHVITPPCVSCKTEPSGLEYTRKLRVLAVREAALLALKRQLRRTAPAPRLVEDWFKQGMECALRAMVDLYRPDTRSVRRQTAL
jgi:hypothetical protein